LREHRLAVGVGFRKTSAVAIPLRAGSLVSTLLMIVAATGCKDDDDVAGSGGTDGATTQGTLPTTGMVDDDDTGGLDGNDDAAMGECLLWDDEACGEGQKCMPWSDDPDRLPDAYRCCPDEGTDVVNDLCTISQYDGSCLDSCVNGSMCLLDDPDNLAGVCRPFCNPSGSDCGPDETCKAFFEALPAVPNVPICMPKCDPLDQDCEQNSWRCIPDTPTAAGQSGFICVPPPPGADKQLFDACALANDCSPGLVCLTAERVPGCTFTSCCSAFCSQAEGDATCQDLHPDMECIDWMAPEPQWSDIGACAIPA
jgi:hypothetical protein